MRLHVLPALLFLLEGERLVCEPALFFPMLKVRLPTKAPAMTRAMPPPAKRLFQQ